MQLYLVRIASLIAIALIYMLFDIFNRRNVPVVFTYATLAYAYVLTIMYLDAKMVLVSTAIALVVLGVGYLVYRIGQLGLADVIEFAALSLIMPIQNMPLLAGNVPQLDLPFILSLLLNAGIIAMIIVPIYYLPKAKRRLKEPLLSFVDRHSMIRTALLAIAYLAFIAFAMAFIGLNQLGILILLAILASSCILMLFSVPITYSMVEYVRPSRFEEGDIIAFNLMDQKSIGTIKSRIKNFDRLLTDDLIMRMKKKKINQKFPVYKEAMPFALPIFIAVIVSITFGNLLFFIFAL